MARVKNRFGLTSQADLNEIIYRRPRPITMTVLSLCR